MKIVKILVISFFTIASTAQSKNLRKLILKSDFIFESSDFTRSEIPLNDYTIKSYVDVHTINDELKSSDYVIPERIKMKEAVDNEDYFSKLISGEGDVLEIVRELEDDDVPKNIFFVIKKDKEYHLLSVFENLHWKQYHNYVRQIKALSHIESMKNDKERFDQTLSWFIDNGLIPDEDFIKYYKQKNIIGDTITYSEEQYVAALEKFKKGHNDLLPIVKDKYFDEVKMFYLNQMQNTINMTEPSYGDYRDFERAVTFLTKKFDNESYFSGKNIINRSLTSDDFKDYEKKGIMEFLLELAKEWE